MRYFWSVTDDGLNIYEDRKKIAKIEPNQFVHLMADLAAHVRYQQVETNKNRFIESRRKDAKESIRK